MLIFLDCWAGAWGSCPSCFPTRARSCTRSAYPLPVFRRVLSLLLLGPPVGGRLDAPRCRSNCADISECLPPMEYLPVCLAGAGCCPLSAPFVSRALGSSPGSRCWGPVTTDHKYPHCSLPLVGPSDCCTRTPPPSAPLAGLCQVLPVTSTAWLIAYSLLTLMTPAFFSVERR